MQKTFKTKREMFNAFVNKYKNVPATFIARNLDYHKTLGECFDSIVDYNSHAIQQFDIDKKIWKNKNL
jgi:hypothetical protein